MVVHQSFLHSAVSRSLARISGHVLADDPTNAIDWPYVGDFYENWREQIHL